MTPPRPRIGRLLGLHPGAIRWLLGARPEQREDGSRRHGAIVRYRYLFAHACTTEAWDEHTAALWKEYGPVVREHRRLRRQRKAAAKERIRERRKVAAEASA
jgi:hypothetical protein